MPIGACTVTGWLCSRRAPKVLSLALALISAGFLPRAQAENTPSQTVILDWRQTATLEHDDRIARFKRLAVQGLLGTPEFYEEFIPKEELRSLGVGLPVLRIVFPQRVFFDTAKWELRPEANNVIDVVANDLRHDAGDVALFIAGHTDSRGADSYNYALSVRRADAVARALYSRGIGHARLWVVGFGKWVPRKPNNSIGNMAQNRRVEFLFAARAEAVATWLSKQSASMCEGATPAELDACRQSINEMPPVVASPVLNDEPEDVPPVLERQTAVAEPDERSSGLAGDQKSGALSEDGRTTSILGSLRSTAEPRETQTNTVTAEPRTSVAERDNQSSIPIHRQQQTVAIEKTSRVVIDVKEQRVTVEGPQP